MQLSKTALKSIDDLEIRLKIALALKVSEQAVIRYINNNDENLTKAAALKVIRDETGLSDDEILVEEKATA